MRTSQIRRYRKALQQITVSADCPLAGTVVVPAAWPLPPSAPLLWRRSIASTARPSGDAMAKRARKPAVKMPPLARVKADRAAGMTPKQMCAAYGVTKQPIMRFLREHGLTKPKRVDYPDDSVIVAALQNREAIAAMAVRFGMSKHSLRDHIITRRLRDLVEPPPPPEPKGLRPTPDKVINALGVSVPRIPTIHGRFEVTA